MVGARALALLAALAVASGCSSGPDYGEVRGDVFLARWTGKVVNLPNTPVHLLPEEAGLDSTLSRLCTRRERALARLRAERGTPVPTDSAERAAQRAVLERAWRDRARLLSERTLRTVTTDERARFLLDSVPPGRYRLWADATVDTSRWTWLEPVRVRAGDSLRVNLSNANADENPLKCQTPLG